MNQTIPQSMESNLKLFTEAQNNQDLVAALGCIHPKSYAYGSTEQLLRNLFANYDLKTTLTRVAYLATDDEFAYARTESKTESLSGEDFNDNITETLIVFADDNGWKIWAQVLLKVKLINPLAD